MAEYIERYTLAKNLCKAICGRDAGLCVAEPKDCRQKEMLAVFDTPATDVSPVVHGRWISWEEAGNFIPSPDRYECSVCHDAAQRLCSGDDMLSLYCPNCGAKMDKDVCNGLDTP